tara:strand:+ start:542 stop:1294 length:753 start_codon:yes stop_codon:yes gene_type:complete
MEKAKLTRYLDKVRIGNHIEQAQISTKDGVSHTWVASKDKDALVVLKMTKSEIPDSVLGIGDLQKFNGLLAALGNDISMDVVKIDRDGEEKSVEVNSSDSYGNSTKYMLHDTSVVPTTQGSVVKGLLEQDYNLKFTLDTNFVSKFITGKSALGDEVETFTIVADNNNVNVVIGWRNTHSNRLSIPVTTQTYEEVDKVSFSSQVMADILSANKECETGTLEMKGGDRPLIKMTFNVDDYNAIYFLQPRVTV